MGTVIITNRYLKCTWTTGALLFNIQRCSNVIIKDVCIIQDNPDFKIGQYVSHSRFRNVVISNVFVLGAARDFHFKIDKLRTGLLQQVESSGYGRWLWNASGGGILVRHTKAVGFPVWTTVENCYFGDHWADSTTHNIGGISPLFRELILEWEETRSCSIATRKTGTELV